MKLETKEFNMILFYTRKNVLSVVIAMILYAPFFVQAFAAPRCISKIHIYKKLGIVHVICIVYYIKRF